MSEELAVEKYVKAKLKKTKAITKFVGIWGSSLLHIDDLAYDPEEFTPASMTAYCRTNERAKVREMFPNPKEGELPLPDLHEAMDNKQREAFRFMPCLHENFGFSQEEVKKSEHPDERTYFVIKGGEKAALERVNGWMHDRDCLGIYKQTRDGFIGADFSSKLSPWLSNGCLSIRRAYWETKKWEERKKQNPSTIHFISELFWRDFFRFWCLTHGNTVFSAHGILKRKDAVWKKDLRIIQRWRDGMTGMPIVDAFMRELNATGFMSNRGRQVVASYLALDMKQDWREGAYYFEEMLLDHDPSSNYGAWCSSAGVGAGRVLVFNTILQSTKFDPAGEYIRTWVPELANVPNDYIHDPWNMPKILQTNSKVQIGGEKPSDSGVAYYPYPIPCDKYTSAEAAKKIKRSSPKSAKDKKMHDLFVAAKKK